ncbi:MAG TPA: ABC transporter permease subunit [Vicinamibacterales bacterium]|nr:ABC transporter permease subunit [Vicinamibacterales bacterium]
MTRGPAFWAIAVKDATETWRDGRFRWAAGLLFLLLVAAIAGGAQHQSRIAQQHADAQAAERDAWLDKGDMNPHAAAHYGAFVFKPVQPLSAIDPGLDPFLGVFVFLEAHKQQLARHRPIEDAAPTRRLGLLTPATAALVLIPLLVVSLTFSSFAGERDQGTLRPLLALGISRWSLLFGKALGAMLPLIVVMIPAAIVAAAFVYVNRPADPDAPIGARAFGLLLVYLAHALVWTGAGLAVSARARSQAAALVVLLALWFANAFVMPPLAMAIAKAVSPSPSALQFAAAIENEKAKWPDWDTRVDRVMERFLDGEFESTMAPANVEVVALIESEAEETALYDRHFADLFSAYAGQTEIYERVSLVSPTLAARMLSMALAGTDDAHDREFAAAAGRYRSQMLTTLNSELAGSGRLNTFDYVRGRDLWEKVPPFDYEVPGAAWAVSQRLSSMFALAGWLAIAAAAAVAGMSSMKVE